MVGGGLLSWLVLIPAIALFGEGRARPPSIRARAHRPDGSRRHLEPLHPLHRGGRGGGGRHHQPREGHAHHHRQLPRLLPRPEADGDGRGRAAARAPSATSRSRSSWAGRSRWPLFMAFLPQLKAVPGIGISILSALAIIVFGFFFAVVSSRITGELGSSSNPDQRHGHRDPHGGVPRLRRCWAGPATPSRRRPSPSAPSSASRPATPAPPARTSRRASSSAARPGGSRSRSSSEWSRA